jgi:hypothetical protein
MTRTDEDHGRRPSARQRSLGNARQCATLHPFAKRRLGLVMSSRLQGFMCAMTRASPRQTGSSNHRRYLSSPDLGGGHCSGKPGALTPIGTEPAAIRRQFRRRASRTRTRACRDRCGDRRSHPSDRLRSSSGRRDPSSCRPRMPCTVNGPPAGPDGKCQPNSRPRLVGSSDGKLQVLVPRPRRRSRAEAVTSCRWPIPIRFPSPTRSATRRGPPSS